MGNGIAIVGAVKAKLDVTLVDLSQQQLDGAKAFARKLLDKDVAKERISAADADAAFARLHHATDMAALSDVDFVVEAVTENLDVKKQIFGQLDKITKPGVILATNTSSISITKLQHNSVTQRPENVRYIFF